MKLDNMQIYNNIYKYNVTMNCFEKRHKDVPYNPVSSRLV